MSDVKTTQIRVSKNCMDNLKSIATQAKLGSTNAIINRLVEVMYDEFCEDHKKFFKAAIAMGRDSDDTVVHRSLRMPEDNLTKLQQMAHKASIKNETVIAWIVDYLLWESINDSTPKSARMVFLGCEYLHINESKTGVLSGIVDPFNGDSVIGDKHFPIITKASLCDEIGDIIEYSTTSSIICSKYGENCFIHQLREHTPVLYTDFHRGGYMQPYPVDFNLK